MELYDINLNKWTIVASMMTRRSSVGASILECFNLELAVATSQVMPRNMVLSWSEGSLNNILHQKTSWVHMMLKHFFLSFLKQDMELKSQEINPYFSYHKKIYLITIFFFFLFNWLSLWIIYKTSENPWMTPLS